jgi:drug/metabolite transporter (DMT)-like permease
MGQFNQPTPKEPTPVPSPPADSNGTGQDLDHYYQGVITELSQEIRRLRADRERLSAEMTQLQAGQSGLQNQRREPGFLPSVPGVSFAQTFLPKNMSQLRAGFFLVLISTIALSIHNVVVRIIGSPSIFLGVFKLGGYLQLGYGNSLLILWYRMFFVLMLMLPIANFLYPSLWTDLKSCFERKQNRTLLTVIGSGAFLFLSQILIYVAIGIVGPSVAVTIFFMYPILTVPMAWLLFKDRPTPLRWLVMAVISLGVILTALPSLQKAAISGGGITAAIASGVAFALYLILTQFGFKKLHPVPGSLVQFFTIFILSSVILLIADPQQLGVQVSNWPGFAIGGIILSVLTLIGYLANNFGVRFMGAARASIIASSGPVLTALLAFLLIQSPLRPEQGVGILLVTAGVTALSLEKAKKV